MKAKQLLFVLVLLSGLQAHAKGDNPSGKVLLDGGKTGNQAKVTCGAAAQADDLGPIKKVRAKKRVQEALQQDGDKPNTQTPAAAV